MYNQLYTFQNNSTYYHPNNGKHIGYAVRECLENLDPYIDYSQYDKFDPEDFDNDNNLREPDGQVDFVLVVFRFFLGTEPATGSGVASLGGTSGSFGTTTSITLDGKLISSQYPGSGAISTQRAPWMYNVHCHEFGHYILGGHRNHNGLNNLMNTNGNSFVSSDEREFLDWSSATHTPTTSGTYTLAEYGTTGQFMKIPFNGKTYYIENRRRIDYHLTDNWHSWPNSSYTPLRPLVPDSALLIHTYYNSFEVAQGKYDWTKSAQYPTRYVINPDLGETRGPIFFIDKSNRYGGENTRNLVNKQGIHYLSNSFLSNVTHWGHMADSNTNFDIGYNQVFSPWSNPPLTPNGTDSLAIEILGKDGNGNLQVGVYFENIPQTAPSKPQDLRVTESYITPTKFNPRLHWSRNLEPDINKYKILRGVITIPGMEPASYTYIGETSDTTYLDNNVELYIKGAGSGNCGYTFRNFAYKILALDNQEKVSVHSERDSISGYIDPCAPEEGGDNLNGETEILKYNLKQNYPNPFNPKTVISYSFPQNGFVTLKVYDIMGREVRTLVQGYKEAGVYTAAFDGSNLASGIYFYKITVNEFNYIRKMLLIK